MQDDYLKESCDTVPLITCLGILSLYQVVL